MPSDLACSTSLGVCRVGPGERAETFTSRCNSESTDIHHRPRHYCCSHCKEWKLGCIPKACPRGSLEPYPSKLLGDCIRRILSVINKKWAAPLLRQFSTVRAASAITSLSQRVILFPHYTVSTHPPFRHKNTMHSPTRISLGKPYSHEVRGTTTTLLNREQKVKVDCIFFKKNIINQ